MPRVRHNFDDDFCGVSCCNFCFHDAEVMNAGANTFADLLARDTNSLKGDDTIAASREEENERVEFEQDNLEYKRDYDRDDDYYGSDY